MCNKLTMYSTKCFILYTIKYIHRAERVGARQRVDESVPLNFISGFLYLENPNLKVGGDEIGECSAELFKESNLAGS